MQPTSSKKEHPLQWLVRYVRESVEELKKVTWPSKDETVKYSVLVVVISLFIGVFIAVLDWALSLGLEQLIAITK